MVGTAARLALTALLCLLAGLIAAQTLQGIGWYIPPLPNGWTAQTWVEIDEATNLASPVWRKIGFVPATNCCFWWTNDFPIYFVRAGATNI